MTCHEFTRAVDPYLDDELSVMEILRMQRHMFSMFSCDACRKVMGAEAAFHAVLRREAVGEEPPASLRERILERVARQDREDPLRDAGADVSQPLGKLGLGVRRADEGAG